MTGVSLALAAFGLAWIVLFVFIHMRTAGRASASETWPAVPGRILASAVVEEESSDNEGGSTTWYNPTVRYLYRAGAQETEGKRLRFGNCRSTQRAKAEAALAAYPEGAAVTVRYNPEKPGESVLETAKPGPLYLFMAGFGLIFVAIALAV